MAGVIAAPGGSTVTQVVDGATTAIAEVQAELARLEGLLHELSALRASAQSLSTQAQNLAIAAASTTGEELENAKRRGAVTVVIGAMRQLAKVVAKHDPDAAAWLVEAGDFGSALVDKRVDDAVTSGLALVRRIHATFCAARKSCETIAVPRAVMQMVPFLAELVTAESSAEVAKAIEAAAAPVGAWRQKYKRRLVAINGMVGAAVGGERLAGVEDSGAPIVTLFAPVGVHATAPSCGGHCEHFGIFLSVLDLGTYVSARLNEPSESDMETVASDSTVSIEQVISPGLYVTVGLSDAVPLVLGVGGAYAPNARRIEAADGSERDAGALRFQAFVAMDIPIVLY